MTREEAKQILEAEFAQAFGENLELAKKIIAKYNKLKVSEYQKKGKSDSDLLPTAMEMLKVLSVLKAEQSGEVINMIVGSGLGGNNPTVLEIVIHGTDVTATAWAKEGLIPQNSAKKAVNAAWKALGLL